MSDLVERLRESASDPMWADFAEVSKPTLAEAADEITRLRQQLGMPLETERENARLRAEVEALRADAERYRYLRNRDTQQVLTARYKAAGCWIDSEDENGALVLVTGDDADAAIDAARKP